MAALLGEPVDPIEWAEDTTPEAVRRLARRLQRLAPGEVRCCYEAGPTGYARLRYAVLRLRLPTRDISVTREPRPPRGVAARSKPAP